MFFITFGLYKIHMMLAFGSLPFPSSCFLGNQKMISNIRIRQRVQGFEVLSKLRRIFLVCRPYFLQVPSVKHHLGKKLLFDYLCAWGLVKLIEKM